MKSTILLATLAAIAVATPAFANEEHMREKFDKHDTNKDGKLSKAEWTAAGDAKFAKADTNGDGSVSFDEKKAMKEEYKDKD